MQAGISMQGQSATSTVPCPVMLQLGNADYRLRTKKIQKKKRTHKPEYSLTFCYFTLDSHADR